MREYLAETFNPGGHLDRALGGYSPRQGQIDYAVAIDAAIRSGRHVLAEGPTGTGKTLAYSVPATHRTVETGKKVLIVTSSIPLQEQLMEKDLPLLASALPWKFRYRMLKGKNNYLCRQSALETEVGLTKGLKLYNATEDESVKAVLTWAAMTEDGDRSNLPGVEPSGKVWSLFSTSSEDCTGSKCNFAEECFALNARKDLEAAHVMVANHHLLFSHLKVKILTGRSIILPEFDVCIIDEGHKIPEVAREFLGFRISKYTIGHLANAVRGIDGDNLRSAAEVYFGALDRYFKSGAYKTRLKKKHPVASSDLLDELRNTAETLKAMTAGESDQGEKAKLKKATDRAYEVRGQIKDAMKLEEEGSAYFIEEMNNGVALRSKKIDVSEWLSSNLFDVTPTVVVTSATLATAKGFDFIAEEMGADHYDEIIVPSPFDWTKQALLVLPRMPDPKSQTFVDSVADRIIEAVTLAGGRTLALFTSWRSLNTTYAKLSQAGLPYRILKQGDMPRGQMVAEFLDDTDSVLLGTESFWAGVDVPGEALSCLVIDKLPFPNFNDPVVSVLNERLGRRFFSEQYVPRAVIQLKQGVGRLIRTVDDHGVVVILDPRVVTKGYGKSFLRALPKMMGTVNKMEKIKGFFDYMAEQKEIA